MGNVTEMGFPYSFFQIFVNDRHPRPEIKNKEIINAYVQMVGIIVGFYFGAKTAMARIGADTEYHPKIPDVQKGDKRSESPMETRNEI